MLGGAYTLSRDAHVRADIFFRLMTPRKQAALEFVLYFLFFFPGILALIFAGWKYVVPLVALPRSQHDEPGQYPDLPVQDGHHRRRRPARSCRASRRSCAASSACRRAHGRRRRVTSRNWRSCSCRRRASRRCGTAARRWTWSSPIASRTGSVPMTNPEVAVLQLGVLVFAIMLGFPVAFTLMALGIGFGFYAYYDADLFVRTLTRLARRGSGLPRRHLGLFPRAPQQPHLRPLREPDLLGHGERYADGDPALPVHGLHRRAREHREPAVQIAADRLARPARDRSPSRRS